MEHYRVITTEGREIKLAMQELWLGGEVLPVGARLTARHVFESAEDDPLEVIYSFMLPRDAALRSFRIEGEGFSVQSELQPVQQAEKVYEEALRQGQLTSMTRDYRDGVTNLMVGNLQPGKRVTVYLEMVAGVEAHDNGFRFRFPFTLAPSYHPRACTAVTAPGEGEMELPEEVFGDVILPLYRDDAPNLHRVGFDLAVRTPGGVASIQSPSHTLQVNPGEEKSFVALSRETDVPNRDLVLDVTFKERKPLVYAGESADGSTSVAAWIPSTTFGELVKQPCRTVFVIDRSGSMQGAPLEQAKKALRACLGALSPEDAFSMVAFDNEAESMSDSLVHGDRAGRDMAERWLDEVDARGGTELTHAMETSALLLKETGGDLFLLTDGQVFASEAIINTVKALGLRVHVVGIGSASQDRFLTQLARQTGGNSRFMTPSERVDQAAMELFASISSPVADELKVELTGENATSEPAPNGTVFAGTPVTVYGSAKPPKALRLNWNQAGEHRDLEITEWTTNPKLGETLRLLRGARLITDFEAHMEETAHGAVGRREGKRSEARLEQLSREYGLASRAMSLVAVVESERDASGKLARTRVVPVGMPEDTRFDAYFGHSMGVAASAPMIACFRPHRSIQQERRGVTGNFGGFFSSMYGEPDDAADEMPADELLIELAARLEPDGGMPGGSDEARLAASLIALLCFAADGNTPETGIYARHVERLVRFIREADSLEDIEDTPGEMVEKLLACPGAYIGWEAEGRLLLAGSGTPVLDQWIGMYHSIPKHD